MSEEIPGGKLPPPATPPRGLRCTFLGRRAKGYYEFESHTLGRFFFVRWPHWTGSAGRGDHEAAWDMGRWVISSAPNLENPTRDEVVVSRHTQQYGETRKLLEAALNADDPTAELAKLTAASDAWLATGDPPRGSKLRRSAPAVVSEPVQAPPPEPQKPPRADRQFLERHPWLGDLPEGGVRAFFAYLVEFDALTEAEAIDRLGGARAMRRFSRNFEGYVEKAPFSVRIDVVSGTKRYVREGDRP